MATDKSDIAIAIVGILNTAFSITDTANSVTNLVNASVNGESISMSIFREWPTTDDLQRCVSNAGGVFVSVNTPPITRNTTRHQIEWETVSKVPVTASLTFTGPSVTVSGYGTAGNTIGLAYGDCGWSYRPTDADTAQTIAHALGALIPNASVTGETISLATNLPVSGGVVSDVTSAAEVMSILQRYTIAVWAPNDALRDAVASTITLTFGQMTTGLAMPDGSQTQPPVYLGSPDHYEVENIGIFRRDVQFDFEFPVYRQQTDYGILFVGGTVNGITFGINPPVG